MAISVKIKSDNRNRQRWELLLKLLHDNRVNCSKVLPNKGFFTAICNSVVDAEGIFSDSCCDLLISDGFIPVMPHDLKMKRSVLAFNLDVFLLECNDDSIIQEINIRNESIAVDELHRLSGGKVIKFVFKTSDMAKNCLSSGLFMFNLRVPPSSLKADMNHMLTYCYKCYDIESHISRDCPKPADYKICSLCSSCDHVYKECKTNVRKCINCLGEHNTLSFSCPARQRFLRKPVVNNKYSDKKSFASVTASKPDTTTDLNLMMIKSFMCFLYASNMNASNPGSFSSTLAKLLRANNLPDFSLGDLECPSFVIPQTMSDSSRFVSEFKLLNASDKYGNCSDTQKQAVDVTSHDTDHVHVPSISENYCDSVDDDYCQVDSGDSSNVDSSVDKSASSRNTASVYLKKSTICALYYKKGYVLPDKFTQRQLKSNENIFIVHECPESNSCRSLKNIDSLISRKLISVIELPARQFNSKKSMCFSSKSLRSGSGTTAI